MMLNPRRHLVRCGCAYVPFPVCVVFRSSFENATEVSDRASGEPVGRESELAHI